MASLPIAPQFVCSHCIRTVRSQIRGRVSAQPISQLRTVRIRARARPASASPTAARASLNVSRTAPSAARASDTGSRNFPSESRPSPKGYRPTQAANFSPGPFEFREGRQSTSTPRPKSEKGTKKWKPVKLSDDIHWYWETLPPNHTQKAQADHWFTKHATPQFLRSVALFRKFPESDVPEVAFVGRSNVGKSSLLNALVNANVKEGLARTSKTPGCTTTLNLYGVGPHDGVRIRPGKNNGHDRIVGIGGLLIVDLPGYGEGSLSEWGTEIMKYLVNRKQLRRVFVLIDASHGVKDKDRSLLASLRLAGVPHQVLLSKLDKIYLPKDKEIERFDGKAKNSCKPHGSTEDIIAKMEEFKSEVQPPQGAGAIGELLGVSAEVLVDGKRLGIDAVRVAVLQAAGVNFEAKKGAKGKVPKLSVPMMTDRPSKKGMGFKRPTSSVPAAKDVQSKEAKSSRPSKGSGAMTKARPSKKLQTRRT